MNQSGKEYGGDTQGGLKKCMEGVRWWTSAGPVTPMFLNIISILIREMSINFYFNNPRNDWTKSGTRTDTWLHKLIFQY